MQLWRRIHPSLHPMQNQQQTPVTWTNLVSRPTTALQSSSSSVTIHLTAGLTARGSYKCTTNNRQQRLYTIMSCVQQFYNHHPNRQSVSARVRPSFAPSGCASSESSRYSALLYLFGVAKRQLIRKDSFQGWLNCLCTFCYNMKQHRNLLQVSAPGIF